MSGENGKNGDSAMIALLSLIFLCVAIIWLIPRFQWVFFEYWRWSRIVQFYVFDFVDMKNITSIALIKDQLINDSSFTSIMETFWGASGEQTEKLNSQYWGYIKEVDDKYTKYSAWFCALIIIFLGARVMAFSQSTATYLNFEKMLLKFSTTNDYYNDLTGKKNRPDKLSYKDAIKSGIIPMTPMEFATSSPPPGLDEKDRVGHKRGPIFDADKDIFDENLAREAFSAQLGKRWTKESDLDGPSKYVYERLKKLVEKGGRVRATEIMDRHAYVYTGLKSLYLEAREGGIVAPSWFRAEVKYKDPFLWRMLSDTGKLPLVMGAGIVAHHDLEKFCGSAVVEPAVEEAIFALGETIGYNPDYIFSGSIGGENQRAGKTPKKD